MAWKGWKHAFAVGTSADKPLTPEQDRAVDRVCEIIRQRKMEPAAVAFLELARPVSYLAAQGLYFFEPFATAVLNADEYRSFTRFLERRDAVEILCDRLIPRDSGEDGENSLISSDAHH